MSKFYYSWALTAVILKKYTECVRTLLFILTLPILKMVHIYSLSTQMHYEVMSRISSRSTSCFDLENDVCYKISTQDAYPSDEASARTLKIHGILSI